MIASHCGRKRVDNEQNSNTGAADSGVDEVGSDGLRQSDLYVLQDSSVRLRELLIVVLDVISIVSLWNISQK